MEEIRIQARYFIFSIPKKNQTGNNTSEKHVRKANKYNK